MQDIYLSDQYISRSISAKDLLSISQVQKINALEPDMQKLSDTQLRDKTAEFKKRLKKGESLDDLLVEAFAVQLSVLDPCILQVGSKQNAVIPSTTLNGKLLSHVRQR